MSTRQIYESCAGKRRAGYWIEATGTVPGLRLRKGFKMDKASKPRCDPELQALLAAGGLLSYAKAFARQYLTAADLTTMSDPELDVFFDHVGLVGDQREKLRAVLRTAPSSLGAPSLVAPSASSTLTASKSPAISMQTLKRIVDSNFPRPKEAHHVHADDDGVWSFILNQVQPR